MSGVSGIRQAVEALRDELQGRWDGLDRDELDAVQYARRLLKRVEAAHRRATSPVAGEQRHQANEDAQRKVRDALAGRPWRGNYQGSFFAQHYCGQASVVVSAPSLDGLLAAIDLVGDLPDVNAEEAA